MHALHGTVPSHPSFPNLTVAPGFHGAVSQQDRRGDPTPPHYLHCVTCFFTCYVSCALCVGDRGGEIMRGQDFT